MSIVCVVERTSSMAMEVAGWLADRLAMPLFPVHPEPAQQVPVSLAAQARRVGANLIVLPVPAEPTWAWCEEVIALLGDVQLPVLLARESAAFAGWAKGVRALCTVVDFDFTPAAERVVHWVERLALAGPVELVVVHEYESTRSVANAAPYTRAQFARASLERELHARLGPLQGDLMLRVRMEPTRGAPVGTIADRAIEERADLIALPVDPRASEALRSVLGNSACCVLCLPVPGPRLVR